MINNIDHSSAHIMLKINIPDKGIYEVRLLLHLCFCTQSISGDKIERLGRFDIEIASLYTNT
mgnify:FL=1